VTKRSRLSPQFIKVSRQDAKAQRLSTTQGTKGQARYCFVSFVPFVVMNNTDRASILSDPPSQGR